MNLFLSLILKEIQIYKLCTSFRNITFFSCAIQGKRRGGCQKKSKSTNEQSLYILKDGQERGEKETDILYTVFVLLLALVTRGGADQSQ